MKSRSSSAVPALGGILPLALCALTQTLRAAPGDPDLTFGTNGVVSGTCTSIGLQSDGKIVAVSGQTVRRFLPNGSADATFAGGAGGFSVAFPVSTHERALAVLPSGKLIVTGSVSEDIALLRLNADGTPDDTFGTGGTMRLDVITMTPVPPSQVFLHSDDTGVGVLPLPNGNLVVAGTARLAQPFSPSTNGARLVVGTIDITTDNRFWRLNTEGTNLDYTVENLALLPVSGKVFVLGHRGSDARYLYDPVSHIWEVDRVEDVTGGIQLQDRAYGMAARPDGTVLLSGDAGESGGFLAGLSSASEWQYDTPKVYGPSIPVQKTIVLQPDGRIVTGGAALVRFMPDGTLDPSFRTLDVLSGVNTVALQSDGKILTAGSSGLRRFEVTTVSATLTVEFPAGTPFEGGGGAPVDFGRVSPGATAAKTFTVRNTSALPLKLWKTALDGAATAGITTDKTFPLTIAPGASTTITVQWAPAAPGALNGILHLINSDSTKRSFDIFLTGTAPAPGPEVAVRLDGTTALTDGQASIIRLSPFRTRAELTFTNAGSAALNFTPVQIDGHATAFTYTSPLPATLAAAASHTTIVEYAPGNQPVSAVMHFGSNDADENPFDIAITGDPSTSSATWRDSWFSGAPPGAPTGDTQDYDGDGVPNILEYATFGNPVEPAGLNAVLVKKGNLLEYTITRPLEASTELLYEFEWTDALTTGPWKTLGTNATVVSQDDSRQRVEFTVASSTGRRFVRLKVTRVP